MSKYHNRKTMIDGHLFDSMAEARRYTELKALERAGEIADIELQPKFQIFVNGRKICTYFADFRYVQYVKNSAGEIAGGIYVIEDVKGMRTDVYRIKRKLVEASYDITITEIVV